VFALSLSIAVVGSLPFLLLNLDANPERVPALWKMALASVDAGIQEEIFYRFFLMSLFIWLGGLLWKDKNGRPTQGVFWSAIIISSIIFGWAHIDDKISNPQIQASPDAFMTMMLVNILFGIIFGWLYWKQGLESAILAHFMVDAIGCSIVVPAYLSDNLLVQASVLLSLVLAGLGSWHLLMGRSSKATNTDG
jgi:membrane protease YdiL (CAAX protease family)